MLPRYTRCRDVDGFGQFGVHLHNLQLPSRGRMCDASNGVRVSVRPACTIYDMSVRRTCNIHIRGYTPLYPIHPDMSVYQYMSDSVTDGGRVVYSKG